MLYTSRLEKHAESKLTLSLDSIALMINVHGDGDGGNPTESARLLQGWV